MVLIIIIVFVASLLQTSTGYGFFIVGTPFLLLIYPAHMAIQINIILSICLSAFMIFKIRKEIDKSLLVRLIKGSVMGLIFGIFIYIFLDIQLLKMTVGALILFLTILLILKLTINRTQKQGLHNWGNIRITNDKYWRTRSTPFIIFFWSRNR